jgi:hypothetical protein
MLSLPELLHLLDICNIYFKYGRVTEVITSMCSSVLRLNWRLRCLCFCIVYSGFGAMMIDRNVACG